MLKTKKSQTSLIISFITLLFLKQAVAKLQVEGLPDQITLGQWSGKNDLIYSSSPFHISSIQNGAASPFTAQLQGSHNNQSELSLFSNDSGKTRHLPVTITLRQLSSRAKQVFTTSTRSTHQPFTQIQPGLRDFILEFQLPEHQLAAMPSGQYSNQFSLNVTNENGEQQPKNFSASVKIPTLIKIGFASDIFINQPLSYKWRRGTAYACIYVNDRSWYRARATSSNYQDNDYHLCKGSGGGNCSAGKIPYSLLYEGKYASPGPVFRFTSPTSYSPWFQGSLTYFTECTQGISTAIIHADASNTAISQAPSGEYSDVVTIIVEPD